MYNCSQNTIILLYKEMNDEPVNFFFTFASNPQEIRGSFSHCNPAPADTNGHEPLSLTTQSRDYARSDPLPGDGDSAEPGGGWLFHAQGETRACSSGTAPGDDHRVHPGCAPCLSVFHP